MQQHLFFSYCRILLTSLMIASCFAMHVIAQDDTGNDASDKGETASSTDLPTERVHINTTTSEQQKVNELANQLPPEQIRWLNVADQKYLAVLGKAWGKQPKGQVVLLHGSGQHPVWPGPINDLLALLPTKGWQTLSISLPFPEEKPLPPRVTSSEASNTDGEAIEPELGANESNEVYDDARDQISDGTHDPDIKSPQASTIKETDTAKAIEANAVDRVIAGVEELKATNKQSNSPLKTFFIAVDTGAVRLWQFLDSQSNEQNPTGIVLIDARNQVPMTRYNLLSSFDSKPIPVLDVLTNSNPDLLQQKQHRHRAAEENGFLPYRSLETRQSSSTNPESAMLNRQILGFLESL